MSEQTLAILERATHHARELSADLQSAVNSLTGYELSVKIRLEQLVTAARGIELCLMGMLPKETT